MIMLPALALGLSIATQQSQGLHDLKRLNLMSNISQRIRSAESQGDFVGALKILEEERMPLEPGNAGNWLHDARLCYEMGKYELAGTYYDRFIKKEDRGQKNNWRTSMECFGMLVHSMVDHKSPDWSKLPLYGDMRSAVFVLDIECQSAIATHYVRTATQVLGEMRKLKADPGDIQILEARIQALHPHP